MENVGKNFKSPWMHCCVSIAHPQERSHYQTIENTRLVIHLLLHGAESFTCNYLQTYLQSCLINQHKCVMIWSRMLIMLIIFVNTHIWQHDFVQLFSWPKRVKLCYYPCNLYYDQFRKPNQLADFHSAFQLTLSQLIFPPDASGR